MTKFLKPETVDFAVKQAGTKVATVTFLKVNGEERTINGFFRVKRYLVGGERGAAASERNKAAGLVALWDSPELRDGKGKDACRSFKRDRVIAIKAGNQIFSAN